MSAPVGYLTNRLIDKLDELCEKTGVYPRDYKAIKKRTEEIIEIGNRIISKCNEELNDPQSP